jgi:hypothetical protein
VTKRRVTKKGESVGPDCVRYFDPVVSHYINPSNFLDMLYPFNAAHLETYDCQLSACVTSYWPVSLVFPLLLARLLYASDQPYRHAISEQKLLLLYSISA